MGISGLLPAIKPSGRRANVKEFRGQRAGVDGYVWLHRACFASAYELKVGLKTTAYIKYFMDRVQLLVDAGVTPVIVFDGADIPLKQGTNADRRERRETAQAKAVEYLSKGDKLKAAEYYARAFDITCELALSVATVLRRNGVEVIVAPYEADAQLAYLMRRGHVDFVITEDSDLLPHGAARVLFKMDAAGDGDFFELDDVLSSKDVAGAGGTAGVDDGRSMSADSFLMACILAGCDYLPSLKGVGIRTALELCARQATIEDVVHTVRTTKNACTPHELPAYLEGYRKAVVAFRHHYVYDPSTKSVVHAHPVDTGAGAVDAELLARVIGTPWSPSTTAGVADLLIDPSTCRPYANTYERNAAACTQLRLRRGEKGGKQKTLFECMKITKKEKAASVAAAPASPPSKAKGKARVDATMPVGQRGHTRGDVIEVTGATPGKRGRTEDDVMIIDEGASRRAGKMAPLRGELSAQPRAKRARKEGAAREYSGSNSSRVDALNGFGDSAHASTADTAADGELTSAAGGYVNRDDAVRLAEAASSEEENDDADESDEKRSEAPTAPQRVVVRSRFFFRLSTPPPTPTPEAPAADNPMVSVAGRLIGGKDLAAQLSVFEDHTPCPADDDLASVPAHVPDSEYSSTHESDDSEAMSVGSASVSSASSAANGGDGNGDEAVQEPAPASKPAKPANPFLRFQKKPSVVVP